MRQDKGQLFPCGNIAVGRVLPHFVQDVAIDYHATRYPPSRVGVMTIAGRIEDGIPQVRIIVRRLLNALLGYRPISSDASGLCLYVLPALNFRTFPAVKSTPISV